VAGLQRWVPLHHGLLGHERREQPYSNPDHLRLALEQLGPSFVKLGQILSTRPDLLPEPYRQELAKLQDSAPPVPAPVIAELVERELAGPPSQIFATFDLEPLASASLGQAHAATRRSGSLAGVDAGRLILRVGRALSVDLGEGCAGLNHDPRAPAGIMLNLGAIALWALSRTAGAPFGPYAGGSRSRPSRGPLCAAASGLCRDGRRLGMVPRSARRASTDVWQRNGHHRRSRSRGAGVHGGSRFRPSARPSCARRRSRWSPRHGRRGCTRLSRVHRGRT